MTHSNNQKTSKKLANSWENLKQYSTRQSEACIEKIEREEDEPTISISRERAALRLTFLLIDLRQMAPVETARFDFKKEPAFVAMYTKLQAAEYLYARSECRTMASKQIQMVENHSKKIRKALAPNPEELAHKRTRQTRPDQLKKENSSRPARVEGTRLPPPLKLAYSSEQPSDGSKVDSQSADSETSGTSDSEERTQKTDKKKKKKKPESKKKEKKKEQPKT